MEVFMVAKALVSIANSRVCLAAGFLMVAGAGSAGAQAYTPPPPPLQLGPCVPTKDFPCDPPQMPPPIPSAAAANPFPGETPGTTNPANSTPSAPGSTAPNSAKPSPSQQFPFPGEPASPAPASGQKPVDSSKFPFPGEPAADPAAAAPASSSSSSSSSSDDSAATSADPDKEGLKDAGSTGSTRFERKKLAVPEDLSKRELDDLEVSHYYITTGNFNGAYGRAQDAVKLYPEDEMAHFALGVAAEKMKKKDEAIMEYKIYLKMAPDGTKAKQVEKSLDLLSAK